MNGCTDGKQPKVWVKVDDPHKRCRPLFFKGKDDCFGTGFYQLNMTSEIIKNQTFEQTLKQTKSALQSQKNQKLPIRAWKQQKNQDPEITYNHLQEIKTVWRYSEVLEVMKFFEGLEIFHEMQSIFYTGEKNKNTWTAWCSSFFEWSAGTETMNWRAQMLPRVMQLCLDHRHELSTEKFDQFCSNIDIICQKSSDACQHHLGT